MAHEFDAPLVRIMSGKKEMILWGAHGAEMWNVAKGAWDALLPLIAPAEDMARNARHLLVVLPDQLQRPLALVGVEVANLLVPQEL